MRIVTALALMGLVTFCLVGCTAPSHVGGQSELSDDLNDTTFGDIPGRAFTLVPDAPAGAVGAVWNESSTEFPYYYAQVVDPYNYPHLVWRAFHTVWSVPFNPLYWVSEGATSSWDQHVQPVRETVGMDYDPAPWGGGEGHKYWASRSNSFSNSMHNSWGTLKHVFLNSNSFLPPYDRWYPEQLQKEKTTIHKTFDYFLFNYDWDDPFVD